MANGRNRREPAFDMKTDAGALDVRLSRADRAGGRMGQAGRRGAAQRDEGSSGGRSVLGRLVYFGLVLGLWGLIGAAAVVGALPIVIMFLALQNQIVGGLTAGAVKG